MTRVIVFHVYNTETDEIVGKHLEMKSAQDEARKRNKREGRNLYKSRSGQMISK